MQIRKCHATHAASAKIPLYLSLVNRCDAGKYSTECREVHNYTGSREVFLIMEWLLKLEPPLCLLS